MSPKIIEQLAPKGVLRVAINLSNFLLVTDRSAEGNPAGVSPDMAAEVARRLGLGICRNGCLGHCKYRCGTSKSREN